VVSYELAKVKKPDINSQLSDNLMIPFRTVPAFHLPLMRAQMSDAGPLICVRGINKKLCEELISSFPLIRRGPHRKRSLQQFFVAAGTSSPSCYLVIIGGYTNPQTHASNNSSIVACIRCRGNVFTESLTSNDRRDTHTDTKTDRRAF
jgi:hypothetical protein